MDKSSNTDMASFMTLLETLTQGTPRDKWRARQAIICLDKNVEPWLIEILNQTEDEGVKIDILMILSKKRIACPATVQAVTRHLNHPKARVRAGAADTLLHASPKLRLVLADLRHAVATEKNPAIRQTIQKLLDRYPHG